MTNDLEGRRDAPWKMSDAPEAFIDEMLKGIVGVEIPILSIDGKWKVSQNRLLADRQGVIEGMRSEQVFPSMLSLMEQR